MTQIGNRSFALYHDVIESIPDWLQRLLEAYSILALNRRFTELCTLILSSWPPCCGWWLVWEIGGIV